MAANEKYTTNYEVACAILDKLENGGGSTGGNIIYPSALTFQNNTQITELDLSVVGGDNLKNLNNFLNGCTNLTKIKGVSNFENIDNIAQISSMLNNTPLLVDDGGLHSLPFTSAITTYVSSCFYRCGLPTIDISRWTVKFAGSMSQFMRDCAATTINLSNQDFSNVSGMSSTAFSECFNLENVICTNTIFPSANFEYFGNSGKISKESITTMFNQLPTVTSATVKINGTVLSSLSSEELEIATNKGWTVTS